MTERESQPAPWSDRDAVLAFVRERDIPCPLCGYNLRNLTEARCPECGKELELRVGLVKTFLGAWIATFAACAPLGGLGLIALLITFREGPPPRIDAIFVVY